VWCASHHNIRIEILLWTTESNFENDENEDRKLDSAHNNVIAAAEVCLCVILYHFAVSQL